MNINQPYQNAYANMLQPRTNGINWVQGIEGAKAYQLAPSSNVMLLDSDVDGRFYIKTSDNIGMCTLRIFKYEEITEEPKPNVDMSQYVTRTELEEMIKSLKGESVDEQPIQPAKRRNLITE